MQNPEILEKIIITLRSKDNKILSKKEKEANRFNLSIIDFPGLDDVSEQANIQNFIGT